MCANTTECKESFTLTPSACACRPGALRPWVLTPGVGAGWGLGAGVVKTCVFPEPCKLLDDRTLPRLPTLPLRSPPPHINTRCRTQHYTHTHTQRVWHTSFPFFPHKSTLSVYLPAVCAAPRCPHWCCSAVPKWESPEDSALQFVNLSHTETHTEPHICYSFGLSILNLKLCISKNAETETISEW